MNQRYINIKVSDYITNVYDGGTLLDTSRLDIDILLNVYVNNLRMSCSYSKSNNTITIFHKTIGRDKFILSNYDLMTIQYCSISEDREDKINSILE